MGRFYFNEYSLTNPTSKKTTKYEKTIQVVRR